MECQGQYDPKSHAKKPDDHARAQQHLMGKHVSGRPRRVAPDQNLVRYVHQTEWARDHKQEVEPSCNARVTLGGKHLMYLQLICRDDTAAGAPKFRISHDSNGRPDVRARSTLWTCQLAWL